MTHGSSTEHPLASGQAGTGIPDCISLGQDSDGALALELASLAALAGDGDTGDTIGITGSCSIITATYPTAEFSSIATTSIMPVDFMEAEDFMVEVIEDLEVANMDSHPMASPAPTQARSAALIMGEPPRAFPHAGNPASEASTAEEDFMAAEAFTEAAATANSVQWPQTRLMIRRIIHAHEQYEA